MFRIITFSAAESNDKLMLQSLIERVLACKVFEIDAKFLVKLVLIGTDSFSLHYSNTIDPDCVWIRYALPHLFDDLRYSFIPLKRRKVSL